MSVPEIGTAVIDMAVVGHAFGKMVVEYRTGSWDQRRDDRNNCQEDEGTAETADHLGKSEPDRLRLDQPASRTLQVPDSTAAPISAASTMAWAVS